MGKIADAETRGRANRMSFNHHGVTQSQIRETIALASLGAATKVRVSKSMAEAPRENSSAAKETRKATRLSAMICSPKSARRMEAYIEKEGLGITEFAVRAGTTDRTLRRFRKTGKVKRSIFEDIAKAMGTTKEALLND